MALVYGCNHQSQNRSIAAEIQASELLKHYATDELIADLNYTCKEVIIVGTIREIELINKSQLNIIIQPKDFKASIIGKINNINKQTIERLKLNCSVRIYGVCKGLISGDIILENCKIYNY